MGRTILQLGLRLRLPIRVIVALAVATALVSCSPPKVLVEIDDEASRAKYIALLQEHEISHRVDERGVIHVEASIEDLSAVDQEYKTWEAEKYRKEGVIILEGE